MNINIIPPSIPLPDIRKRIEEPDANKKQVIQNPESAIVKEITETNMNESNSFDLPPAEGQNESIELAIMVEIRRLKMKKHKRRKFLKRMKFEHAKRKLRREQRKEKDFQAELLAQIRQAEKFSAEFFVADKLARAKAKVKLPSEICRI